MEHRLCPGRQQRRQRRCGGGGPGVDGPGVGRHGIDSHPVDVVRAVRIKPQRDRVPLAPHDDAWNGLSVNGPMARTVEDAALFLDVTSDDSGFVAAAAKEPGRLRIALSTKVPPMLTARVGKPQRAAVDEAGALLRELGHQVVVRDPTIRRRRWRMRCPVISAGSTTMCRRCPTRSVLRPGPQLRPDRRVDLGSADEQDQSGGKRSGRTYSVDL